MSEDEDMVLFKIMKYWLRGMKNPEISDALKAEGIDLTLAQINIGSFISYIGSGTIVLDSNQVNVVNGALIVPELEKLFPVSLVRHPGHR